MRFLVAIGVVFVAIRAALGLHGRSTLVAHPAVACAGRAFSCAHRHPSWQDPVAVLVAVAGLAIAAAVLTARPTASRGHTFGVE